MIESITVDKFGKQVWRNIKNPHLFAERPYISYLVVTLIDETDGRANAGTIALKDLKGEDWIPMTVEEYNKSKKLSKYREVYEN